MTVAARAVFVLLVGATFAAFFVAQRLKSAPTVIGLHHVVMYFSPNGDGRRDASTMRVRVKERDDVTVTVVDDRGTPVRRLVVARTLRPGRPLRLSWDGRDDAGARAPDGIYHVRVGLRRQGRALTFPRDIRLDTTAPRPRIEALDADAEVEGPQWIAGPVLSAVDVRIRNPSRRGPSRLRVLRTDAGPQRDEAGQAVATGLRADAGPPRVVAHFTAPPGETTATWDGRLDDGTEAPAGTYLVAISVSDIAGNVGTSPPLPVQRGDVPGVPGLSVRRLLVRPPADPVRAGEEATFAVDSRGRAFKWRIRRPGAGKPVASGRRRTGGEITVRLPDVRSGLYLFEARAGRTSADTTGAPFAVQGAEAAPILVVLPAITWYGSSAVDDDRDGLPDTLGGGAPVPWPRLLTGLPAGLADQVAPLLVFLDRQDLRYDVTTDLALAASRSGLTEDRKGVLLPGPLRWVPRSLAQRLRAYVSQGGRLASFGADSLRRGVDVTRTRLLRPLPAVADDPFGARLRPVRRLGEDEAVLQPVADEGRTGLLTGIDALSGFAVAEESEPSERVLAALAAVDEEAIAAAEESGDALPVTRPALTLSRLGEGSVIRAGLPEWGLRLQEDPAVRQLTRNIADILRHARPKIRF